MENIKIYKIDNDFYVFNKVYDHSTFYTFTGRDIVNDMWSCISIFKDRIDVMEELEYDEFVAMIL